MQKGHNKMSVSTIMVPTSVTDGFLLDLLPGSCDGPLGAINPGTSTVESLETSGVLI